jgi:hypothetical protein
MVLLNASTGATSISELKVELSVDIVYGAVAVIVIG